METFELEGVRDRGVPASGVIPVPQRKAPPSWGGWEGGGGSTVSHRYVHWGSGGTRCLGSHRCPQ